jgi:hypothetical protein
VSVTKRTRYEVLRRDSHACRYCGAAAPDATLTIDHVTPVALGGGDDPSNLVAACKDCNAGKSSSNPDACTVAAVSDDAIRWSAALKAAAASVLEDHEQREAVVDAFRLVWDETPCASWREPVLPEDWRLSVENWIAAGLPPGIMYSAIESAFCRRTVAPSDKFRYVAGICWKRITEIQDAARTTLTGTSDGDAAEDVDDTEDYWMGYGAGFADGTDQYAPRAEFYERADFPHRILMGHVDRRTSTSIEAVRWVA